MFSGFSLLARRVGLSQVACGVRLGEQLRLAPVAGLRGVGLGLLRWSQHQLILGVSDAVGWGVWLVFLGCRVWCANLGAGEEVGPGLGFAPV